MLGERGPSMNPEGEPDSTVVDTTRKKISGFVNESRLPAEEYESTVGTFGGKFVVGKDGELVYNMKGLVSRLDQFGDAVLRTYDEHTMNRPMDVLMRHPGWFFSFIVAGTKRYRGSPAEIAEHIHELGLDEHYALHPDGIEVKQPERLAKSIALQDIFRSDQIVSRKLEAIDRFQALAEGARYVRAVHKNGVGVGELLPSDILFQNLDDQGAVMDPVLNIPDIVYNKRVKKKVGGPEQSTEARRRDQKATDLLDFMFSIGIEELRRSSDWDQVGRALKTIVEAYEDADVLKWVISFSKRGRLTLIGDKGVLKEAKQQDALMKQANKVFGQHNRARLGTDATVEGTIRQAIIDACDGFLEKPEAV